MAAPKRTTNKEVRTDVDLVRLSLEDSRFYGELVERYQAPLSRFVARLARLSNEDCEDIVQETFINAYRNLRGYDSRLKFSSWLYRICHNQAISHLRKRNVRPQIIENQEDHDLVDLIASDLNVEHEVLKKFESEAVHAVLAKLKVDYREIIVLRYMEELDYKEIADILRRPMGTVATLLNRAKKEFKNMYEKES